LRGLLRQRRHTADPKREMAHRARRLAARDASNEIPDFVEPFHIRAALETLAAGEFPKQCRPHVQPVGLSQVSGVSLGLVAAWGNEGDTDVMRVSRSSTLLPELTRLLCRFCRQSHPDFGFTSIQINYGFASREHVDPHNAGLSWIYAIGDYDGGDLWVENSDGELRHSCSVDVKSASGHLLYQNGTQYRGSVLNVHNQWQCFDGRRLHFTTPIQRGKRFSLIFYTSTRYKNVSAPHAAVARELGFLLPTETIAKDSQANAVRSWFCSTCGQDLKTRQRYRRHIRQHAEPLGAFGCEHPGCKKRFHRPEHLRRHMLTHESCRPYACTHLGCGRTFADASGLNRHLRRHLAQPDGLRRLAVVGVDSNGKRKRMPATGTSVA